VADDTEWLNDAETEAWRTFINVTATVIRDVAADLKRDSGLSFDDYDVLVHLSEAPDHRLRMTELSDRVLHSRSRLTQRIDRMADRGLVQREQCPEDLRGTWAVLTSDGLAAIVAAAPGHLESVRQRVIDRFDEVELASLRDLLNRMVDTPPDPPSPSGR